MIIRLSARFRQHDERQIKWLINCLLQPLKLMLLLHLSSICLQLLLGFNLAKAFSFGTSKSSMTVIDEIIPRNSTEFDDLIKLICTAKGGSRRVISRQSTVTSLAKHFLTSDAYCGDNPLDEEPLSDLMEVLEESPDNVCSPKKIAAIENFHHKYISTTDEDLKAREDDAPELLGSLKLFFIHYALEVSANCQKMLIPTLEFDHSESFDLEQVSDTTIERLNTLFGLDQDVYGYDDVILVWDLIESALSLLRRHRIPVELPAVVAKLADPRPIWTLQERCKTRFRPVYEELILPLIRLADLGYSWDGEHFAREIDELRKNKLVGRWYGMTQICEAILPMEFYRDSNMTSTNEIVLISREQAKEFESYDLDDIEPIVPPSRLIMLADQLPEVNSVEVQKLTKRVKTKQSASMRRLKRTLNRFGRQFRSWVESKGAKLFVFSESTEEKKVEVNVLDGPPIEPSVSDLIALTSVPEREIETPLQRLKSIHEDPWKGWQDIFNERHLPRGKMRGISKLMLEMFLGVFIVILGVCNSLVNLVRSGAHLHN